MHNSGLNAAWPVDLHFESPQRSRLIGAQLRTWVKRSAWMALMGVMAWLLTLVFQLVKHQETYQATLTEQTLLNQKIAEFETKQKKSQIKISTLTPTQLRGYNAVIRQINIPWQDIFEDLERATPADVALISIEPDGQRASVKLQAEAKTLATLLSYADSLQQRGVLGRITYSKHETNEQDKNKPVRLSLELALLPPPKLATLQTRQAAP